MLQFCIAVLLAAGLFADNQTPAVTTPLAEDSLPFRVSLEQADFSLPVGLHSFAYAIYDGEWLLLSGRTNGLHDVDNTDPNTNSFPTANQNTSVFVVNPKKRQVYSRSLYDSTAHLSQEQIDLLSVTNALAYQTRDGRTLYVVGGYGIDTAAQVMTTKPALTAIDVPAMIQWVKNPKKGRSAAKCIRQIFDPLLQVTGGMMWQSNAHQPYLLAFGQTFTGNYLAGTEGVYTQQIRPFQIIDNGKDLHVQPHSQMTPTLSYRRRDLNVVPIIKKQGSSYEQSFVTLSGVFTPGGGGNPGAWTVPIEIDADGSSFMPDPSDPNTFAQGMNNYSCASAGLYSQKKNNMYILLFGGLSYLIMSDGNPASCTASPPVNAGILTPCDNLPFVNDITTIRIDAHGNYQQYLMSGKYPTITATFGGGAGGPIWFGSSAVFFPAEDMPLYPNNVIAFDKLGSSSTLLGYIVGGIASSLTDTNDLSDSIASTYIFRVVLTRP